MPYLIVFIIALYFVYTYDIKKKKRGRELSYFILFLSVVLLAGCRYVIGGDTVRYMRSWDEMPTFSSNNVSLESMVLDPLWILLNVTCKSISDDFIFFQFVHAILLNGILFYGVFIKQEYFKRHVFTVVLFYLIYYLLYFNMEILRESLAVALFLLNLPNYQNKKWKKYYLLATISILLHSSAIVVFFIPLFRNVKLKLRYVVFMVLIAGVFFTLFGGMLVNLLGFQVLSNKFELYADKSMNFNGKILRTIEFVIIPLVIIHLNDVRLKKRNPFFASFYMSYFFVAALSTGNTTIGGRFINYVSMLMIGYYVYVLYNVSASRYLGFLRNGVLTLFLIVPFVNDYRYYFIDTSDVLKDTKKYFRWYPYASIFQKGDQEVENLVKYRIYYADRQMFIQANK